MQTAAQAGLQVYVTGLPWYGPWLAPYLQAARASGLRVIWYMNKTALWGISATGAPVGYDPQGTNLLSISPYNTYAAAPGCNCTTNAQLLQFIVSTLTTGAPTYGWYVADDSQIGALPAASVQPALHGIGQLAASLRSLAPGTVTLMSAWGDANTTQFQQAYGLADLTAEEVYPLMGQDASAASVAGEITTVASSARLTQSIAASHGGPSALILQAFSWGTCQGDRTAAGVGPGARYPGAAEMVAMRNAALTNSQPQLLLWYSLQGTIGFSPQQPATCNPIPDAATRLASLTAAVTAPAP